MNEGSEKTKRGDEMEKWGKEQTGVKCVKKREAGRRVNWRC